MKNKFFHDIYGGDEWYTIEQIEDGRYKAVCTRGTENYYLGQIGYFFFYDRSIWSRGKFKAHNHSLTLIKFGQRHDQQSDADRQDWQRTGTKKNRRKNAK